MGEPTRHRWDTWGKLPKVRKIKGQCKYTQYKGRRRNKIGNALNNTRPDSRMLTFPGYIRTNMNNHLSLKTEHFRSSKPLGSLLSHLSAWETVKIFTNGPVFCPNLCCSPLISRESPHQTVLGCTGHRQWRQRLWDVGFRLLTWCQCKMKINGAICTKWNHWDSPERKQ